ncbi:hypothetical protein F4561_006547 [Lipingzhangella halophila]|uniref:Holin n=1 Tax=Lipingzhangella halophila TaxID=1783352 RepID=A0A7W7W6B0_9ACTN|nr:hypothetical protein [Lipingzhangella halophila]MBB4935638.1 hypothetical protein [Lipingzhangella halophila]
MPSKTTTTDARSRSLRTVAQGAVAVVLLAVAGVVADQVTPGELVDYASLGVGAATAAGTALAAYVQRVLEGDTPPAE